MPHLETARSADVVDIDDIGGVVDMGSVGANGGDAAFSYATAAMAPRTASQEEDKRNHHVSKLLDQKAFWTGARGADFWFYTKNNHPLLSVCLADPHHPFDRGERLVANFVTLALSFMLSVGVLTRGISEGDEDYYFWVVVVVTLPTLAAGYLVEMLAKCAWVQHNDVGGDSHEDVKVTDLRRVHVPGSTVLGCLVTATAPRVVAHQLPPSRPPRAPSPQPLPTQPLPLPLLLPLPLVALPLPLQLQLQHAVLRGDGWPLLPADRVRGRRPLHRRGRVRTAPGHHQRHRLLFRHHLGDRQGPSVGRSVA